MRTRLPKSSEFTAITDVSEPLLLDEGRFGAAIASFRGALERNPNSVDALTNLANAYAGFGRLDNAVIIYRRALDIAPENAGLYRDLGRILQELGELQDSVICFTRAVELAPDEPSYRTSLAQALRAHGEIAEAIRILDKGIQLRPGDSATIALKGVLHTEMGDMKKAQYVFDYYRLIKNIRINPPTEFKGVSAFNDALANHVLNHPALVRDLPDCPTRDGYTVGNLLAEPKGPMAALEQIILAEVSSYIETLPDDPNHPLTAGCPERAKIKVWGTVLNNGGYQIPHHHPEGWLSGVYYPKLVEETDFAASGRGGILRFGGLSKDVSAAEGFESMDFRPEEGQMLLFPSYFWHGTTPFDGKGPRVSIAFDLVAEHKEVVVIEST